MPLVAAFRLLSRTPAIERSNPLTRCCWIIFSPLAPSGFCYQTNQHTLFKTPRLCLGRERIDFEQCWVSAPSSPLHAPSSGCWEELLCSSRHPNYSSSSSSFVADGEEPPWWHIDASFQSSNATSEIVSIYQSHAESLESIIVSITLRLVISSWRSSSNHWFNLLPIPLLLLSRGHQLPGQSPSAASATTPRCCRIKARINYFIIIIITKRQRPLINWTTFNWTTTTSGDKQQKQPQQHCRVSAQEIY